MLICAECFILYKPSSILPSILPSPPALFRKYRCPKGSSSFKLSSSELSDITIGSCFVLTTKQLRDRSLLIVGVGPKRKWLGQEKMLSDQGWVKKKLNSHGGWVKKILGIITSASIKLTIFKKILNRKIHSFSILSIFCN